MKDSPVEAEQPRVLILDIGSSSARACIFDGAARGIPPLPEMRRRYRWRNEPEGAMEIDPDLLVAEVGHLLDAASAQVRSAGGVLAVGIATFWHSIMGVDAAGVPSTPLYGWGDTRAGGAALELRERVDEAPLHRRTGCFLHPSYPFVRLAWLRTADPGAFARTARWVSFPEYLAWRLLGRWRVSLSMASGSGLLDVHSGDWDEEALSIAGIERSSLSPLVDADDRLGGLSASFAPRWPELSGVPWFPALGDGACANAGSGALGPASPGVTIGTSAAVRTLWQPAGSVLIPDDIWCYRLDRRWWVAGGALSNGGGALAQLRRMLALPAGSEEDPAIEALPPAGHGLTVLPFLRGERGPGWTDERGGSVVGLTDTTRPEEILRAWMEAIAYRIVRVERRLEDVIGPASRVIASGGALQASAAWTRILADALDRPVLLAAEPEETSRGAALVVLEALGVVPDLAVFAAAPAWRIEPDPAAHAAHADAMARQQRLLETLAPWMRGEEHDEQDRFS